MSLPPSRGEVWLADLDPTIGHEQSGQRPVLVISADSFNDCPAELVVVIPLTSVEKRIPFHIRIDPPEGGLKKRSYAKCEDVRSISTRRLGRRLGIVSSATMTQVEDRIRLVLGL